MMIVRLCLFSGGIPQTVTGDNFTSVSEPLMQVIVWCLEPGVFYPQAEQACRVLNATTMHCPASPLKTSMIPCIDDGESVASRDGDDDGDDGGGHRVKRLTLKRFIRDAVMYVRVVFDGYKKYDNLSRSFREEGN